MITSEFQRLFQAMRDEVERVIVGQQEIVEQVLVALLARGHVLVEGVPGLGKTLLARSLAAVVGVDFKRIQFTPDLMPTDITGGNVFDTQRSQFVFQPGPVFTQFLLADEINRAPAKTQSALLEAMQEGTVTADGASRKLPDPFFVMATQNPVESQGTYPLPRRSSIGSFSSCSSRIRRANRSKRSFRGCSTASMPVRSKAQASGAWRACPSSRRCANT